MACLKESTLQGYLEEFGASPFRKMVESRLASCARCRAAFDCVVATNRRVNAWLSRLASPAEGAEIRTAAALAGVLSRVETTRMFDSVTEMPGTNPRVFAFSAIFQSAIVALLMLIGTNEVVRNRITRITLIAPPPAVKPIQPIVNHGGGGGQQSPLPPLKGQLPKPSPRVFTAPLVTTEHPALTIDASLFAPPDSWAAPSGPIGNPLGTLNGAGGSGQRGGIGTGVGVSVGNSTGVGIGDIFTAGNGITNPELIVKVDPEYSEEAREAKYSGDAMLSIVVDTDGKASGIQVVRSLGMGLDEKAVEAVRQWRFRPGMSKGVPVRVRAQVRVTFRLL